MRFRDGNTAQRILFVVFVATYFLGLGINLWDKLDRAGKPDVGWVVDDGNLSPTRLEASKAGLLGGGHPIAVNGEPYPAPKMGPAADPPALLRRPGQVNVISFRRPTGEVATAEIEVRLWQWRDAIFSEGATLVIGLLFFVVGVTTFVLRPYTAQSWALLSVVITTGGLLSTLLIPSINDHTLAIIYFMVLVGMANVTPLHAALAFPVAHPLLTRGPLILAAIYAFGFAQAFVFHLAWTHNFEGVYAWVRVLGALALLISIGVFLGRCVQMIRESRDRLVRQRAWILLGGSILGLLPSALAQVLQQAFNTFAIDSRLTYWTLGAFLFALGHTTLREEMLNARIAVRRAVLYAAAVIILTAAAWILTLVTPYAVAGLLLPLLYVWPRFDDRLNEVLYPKRAHFPEILGRLGDDMAESTSIDTILDKLASAPTRLCDATRSVAFIIPGGHHPHEHYRASDGSIIPEGKPLNDETVVKILTTTRKTIRRSGIAIQPHFSEIKKECYQGLDRLGADVLLPVVMRGEAIGGLAIGPRSTGDLYEQPELEVLGAAAQQAVQAIIRVEATNKLRLREQEFSDLKRFFSPQVIDQVMAKGGTKLRSQRKLVTVFFADLRGFTSFSDSVEPEEVMSTLAEYHNAMGTRIGEYDGTLERFAGDGFMVFFNDPVEQEDHTQRAVDMALAMLTDVRGLRQHWSRKGYDMHVGMGIHTGYATCGFIGYEGRRDYGVIGNVTNMAARLSDTAAAGEILITPRVRSELRNGYQVEQVGDVDLKGFAHAQSVYRLLGNPGHSPIK